MIGIASTFDKDVECNWAVGINRSVNPELNIDYCCLAILQTADSFWFIDVAMFVIQIVALPQSYSVYVKVGFVKLC